MQTNRVFIEKKCAPPVVDELIKRNRLLPVCYWVLSYKFLFRETWCVHPDGFPPPMAPRAEWRRQEWDQRTVAFLQWTAQRQTADSGKAVSLLPSVTPIPAPTTTTWIGLRKLRHRRPAVSCQAVGASPSTVLESPTRCKCLPPALQSREIAISRRIQVNVYPFFVQHSINLCLP